MQMYSHLVNKQHSDFFLSSFFLHRLRGGITERGQGYEEDCSLKTVSI